jgi:HEAT repeat protein
MSTSLSDGVRVIFEHLVNGPDEQRKQALVELAVLADADKRDAADYLCECLPKEQNSTLRGWYLSALAAMRVPDDAATIIAYLDPNKEREEGVRGWAAISLAKVKPPDYEKSLERTKQDPSSRVRAISLRLLIEDGIDETANTDELLKTLRTPKDVGDRLAVLKALRASGGNGPLPQSLEQKLMPILRSHLLAGEGVETEQRQVALVLGDFKHEWAGAIDILYRALELHHSAWVRRACVRALTLTQRTEAKKAFAFAVKDKDQEVRTAAANGLRQVLGASEAVRFLVEEYVLRDDYPSPEYIEALRNIDRALAADVLLQYLQGGDSRIASQALQALALLGIDGVTRVFRSQRVEVVEGYTKSLSKIDDQVFAQINNLTKQAERASNTSIRMYAVFFAFGLVVLSLGLLGLFASVIITGTAPASTASPAIGTPFSSSTAVISGTANVTTLNPPASNARADTASLALIISIGVTVASLITLMLLFYRNPLEKIRRSAAGFVQVNVAFLGYIRQIHQIDLVFKQMFIAADKPDSNQLKATLEQIQTAVEHTVEEVRSYLVLD